MIFQTKATKTKASAPRDRNYAIDKVKSNSGFIALQIARLIKSGDMPRGGKVTVYTDKFIVDTIEGGKTVSETVIFPHGEKTA